MKKLKLAVLSFAVGLVFAAPTVAVFAQCAQMIIVHGKRCTLVGEDCGPDVCICAYICE